jgi:hypothetical protein
VSPWPLLAGGYLRERTCPASPAACCLVVLTTSLARASWERRATRTAFSPAGVETVAAACEVSRVCAAIVSSRWAPAWVSVAAAAVCACRVVSVWEAALSLGPDSSTNALCVVKRA